MEQTDAQQPDIAAVIVEDREKIEGLPVVSYSAKEAALEYYEQQLRSLVESAGSAAVVTAESNHGNVLRRQVNAHGRPFAQIWVDVAASSIGVGVLFFGSGRQDYVRRFQ